MKLQTCRDKYYEASGTLSENARKLSFAGIAVIWIFKRQSENVVVLPQILTTALLFFVACLTFDLAQYIYQSVVWCRFHDQKENELNHNEKVEFLAPKRFTVVANLLLVSKVLLVVIGYVCMLIFLADESVFNSH
jgi:hypothetical protein